MIDPELRHQVHLAVRRADREAIAAIVAGLTNAEVIALSFDWDLWARPAERRADGTWSGQTPPQTTWDVWLLLAGRGYGKTRSGAEFVRREVKAGRASHLAFIGQDPGDVREIMIDGPSGIMAVSPPDERPTYNPSKKLLTWPNGAVGHVYSANDPESLRGPEFDLGWGDELCAWAYPRETWDNYQFGLRRRGPDGGHPRTVITTTPKPIALLKEIMADEGTVITRGSTYDNVANLAEAFVRKVVRRYEGTSLGRQELYAELMQEVEGALWSRLTLDTYRVLPRDVPELTRIVVGVDPMAKENARRRRLAPPETGIVIAGLGEDGHGYVLADRSTSGKPDRWASRVINGYHDYEADRVIAETNNGGDMVVDVIQSRDRRVPVRQVTASRGKKTRAEPISMLYEQGMIHHVGSHAKLEDQLVSWTGADGEPSPDRLDALVWAMTSLMLGPGALDVRIDPSVGHVGSTWRGI